MMTEAQLARFITETISEDMFIIRRKIEVIQKVIENYDDLDCEKPFLSSYQRIYCENMRGWSIEKIRDLKNKMTEKLHLLISQEIRKNKFSKK